MNEEAAALLREIWSWLSPFALGAAGAALLKSFVFQLIRVKGASMEHTLKSGDVLLVIKTAGFRRGDVVICRYPRRTKRIISLGAAFTLNKHALFVKRLAALPGDTVEILSGQLLVNGLPAPDPPEMGSLPRDYPLRRLGPGEYFVIGDNRFSSHDSRSADVGPLPRGMLRGKAKLILWPPGRWRRVK